MVTEWLVPIAAAGGSALVGAAATDVWQAARAGVMQLYRRGGEERSTAAGRWADETAAAVAAAPQEQSSMIRQEQARAWQQRLADLVDEFPDLAEALQVWAEQTRAALPATQQGWVNTFVARDHATQYNAPGGTITVHHDQQ